MGLTFLVGGSRSGKSRLAQAMAARTERPVVVIATAEAGDDEMAARIGRHRADRPPGWTTFEEPIDLDRALRSAAPDAFVVIDCLTLWVSNLLGRELTDDDVAIRADAAAELAAAHPGGAVAVSNEVGMGVVPANAMARRYADLLGRVNATWAAAADRPFLVVAGRTIPLGSLDA
jgi:adenosyl cobinamide kinase/adenosyl cobinamide phosphate guanylyltransferase